MREELKGPRADAPAQALAGFLGKTGLTREQLVERADAKGNAILFAVIEKPGRATAAVLAEAIPAVIRGFPWPKSMRWGVASTSTASLRWVRPLQGIVALLGDDLVECEVDGIVSGTATLGHRFHHPGPITIGNADDYAAKLRACHVILDPAERRAIIAGGAAKAAAAHGLSVVPDEGLVAENAGLTEWPVPLLGRFDPAFLTVPREVIQLTMRTNQKYFAAVDAQGALAPAFVCTANVDANDGGAAIVAGNEKVLAARLSDAKFFWEQDLRTSLATQAQKLDQIVFHEKLGTVADKVARVAKLARWLVEEGIIPLREGEARPQAGRASDAGADPQPATLAPPHPDPLPTGERERWADMAEQAARLCKADLVTGMVGEFPELQGVMGGYYARAEGLPDAVADAIRDHYKPVGQGDEVPTAPVTVAVSLADKLDTLLSFWFAGEKPTGSKDPFALRRAALAVLKTLVEQNISLPVLAMLAGGIATWATKSGNPNEYYGIRDRDGAQFNVWIAIADNVEMRFRNTNEVFHFSPGREERHKIETVRFIVDTETVLNELRAFFADRLKVQQREAGVRHDLIDAVFALGGEDDLVRLLARVHALQAFVSTEDGANLLAGYKRAANILKKEGWTGTAPPAILSDACEQGIAQTGEEDPLVMVEDPDFAEAVAALDARMAAATLAYAPEPAETALIAALDRAEATAATAIAVEDFGAAMTALASLRGPIDAFFDPVTGVTVNDPDPAKRAARLGLLARIRDAVHRVADFSKIES